MRVSVGLGERAYEVVIGHGLLGRAGEVIGPVLAGRRSVVVADTAVARLYAAPLAAALAAAMIEIPCGEGSKSFAGLERLCDDLLGLDLDRDGVIVAVGGGVVGDLAGLAAALYKRGVGIVQVPTTLLAQVDASVGGKTAIDTPRGKNLIGAFHQPRLVVADLDTLATLPDRHLRAGYAEIVKCGLLGDAEFFAWLETEGGQVLARDAAALEVAVGRCVTTKAGIVAADEHDRTGRRALLNVGHTFAHALEAETGFGDRLLHGEAVALGCILAFRLSARLGHCGEDDARRAEAVFAAAGLPVDVSAVSNSLSAERLLAHMVRDKKAEAGQLVLVLARGIGDAFVARETDPVAVRDFLIAQGALP